MRWTPWTAECWTVENCVYKWHGTGAQHRLDMVVEAIIAGKGRVTRIFVEIRSSVILIELYSIFAVTDVVDRGRTTVIIISGRTLDQGPVHRENVRIVDQNLAHPDPRVRVQ